MEEKDLIAKAKSGDIYSFEQLISRYQKSVYNIIYNMIGNEEEANDISQEVFIKVFKSLTKFRGESSFSTWLYSIAKNIFINESKRYYNKKKSIETSLDDNENLKLLNISDGYNVVEEFEIRELQEKVRQAIQQLPEEFIFVVILYYLEGFSYEEIAKIMDSSIGTVKSRLSRGKEHLKEILSNMVNFSDFNSESINNKMIL
ncbi:MAG: hypothetical protein A2539_06850 [Elusimicrobia bacterium RIFOXYD2_FULL_34_15]|nr:MAG: hypothetical protein A2539_06850 [Elusimicrobia bacterium RIFOXYD2_FULL_34_15]